MKLPTEHPTYEILSTKLHPQDFEVLKQILVSYEFDLYPSHGYFSSKDFIAIKERAINEFFKRLSDYGVETLDETEIRDFWSEVVKSFNKDYWGFKKSMDHSAEMASPQKLELPLRSPDEIPKKPMPKVSFSENFFYIWTVIHSFIFTKALVVVFGRKLAIDDSIVNRLALGLVLVLMYGSLIWFAWHRHKKRPN